MKITFIYSLIYEVSSNFSFSIHVWIFGSQSNMNLYPEDFPGFNSITCK